MKEKIQELLSRGETAQAKETMEIWKQTDGFRYDDTAAVLEASLYAETDAKRALDCIYKGLAVNPFQHELYFMLGQIKEVDGQLPQAQFSYENALYYSTEADYDILWDNYCAFRGQHEKECRGVSVVLVTYNQLEMTKLCVESIRSNTPAGTYEIIVVDNLSCDGTREWLVEQEDLLVLLNEENKGFPAACNQGAQMAGEGNDIFLLNNDTIVMKNSIYNLRMALYENERNGAVGAFSNKAGAKQTISEQFGTLEEYGAYARRNNAYSPERHERCMRLIGFALMSKYDVWRQVSGLDERYGLGNFEDDDFCMKLLAEGYQLFRCPDSFIYHFGGMSFGSQKREKKEQYQELLQTNRTKFEEKWNVKWPDFSHARTELFSYIERDRQESFSVLEIGCGRGATLIELGNTFPGADCYGMESEKEDALFASRYLPVKYQEAGLEENPFPFSFDYVVMANCLEQQYDTEQTLCTLREWLAEGGCLLCSFYNVMHISVVMKLLQGNFSYSEEGILEKKNIRLFSQKNIMDLMERCGFEVLKMGADYRELDGEERRWITRLGQLDASVPEQELSIYQYRVLLRKKQSYSEIRQEIEQIGEKIKGRLYTPTCMEKIGDNYWIVDCWHNRVIYSSQLTDLSEWSVLDSKLWHPHSICGGKGIYAVENTEKGSVCFYQEEKGRFEKFDEVSLGKIPHRLIYDDTRDIFWVLGGGTQEIYGIRSVNGRMELCCRQKIEELQSSYVRSMRMIHDRFYLVSGPGAILELAFSGGQFLVENRYEVPLRYYEMNDIIFFDGFFWISVYVSREHSFQRRIQPALLRVRLLEDFMAGKYEDLYHLLGMRGIPYYFSWIDGKLCIPEIDTYSRIVLYDVNEGELTVNRVLYDCGQAKREDILCKNAYRYL